MLILEDILDKMKIHFPRWMDIRRKIKTSTGGLYLSSIAENIADIQSAINDYKKDFFIDNYFGKEDSVIAFLYKVPIGTLDSIKSLTLILPEYTLTTDQDVFYNNDNYAYYEDGFLYFKNNEDKIIYSIDNYKYEGTAEKIHVWNIFDEFAIFLGLKRFQWETNKELLNRILAFAKFKSNSSDDGLKNAILANLVNIAPELKKEDILIERPTAENLVKYYDQYETILDHLMEVNRDVYKEKVWDVDTWNFAIKSVDFIPHAWDILLTEYVNGVGFDDDLKVEIVDNTLTTNVTIYFYKKQIEMINDYIKNNNVRKSFKFDLKKYNENINTKNVKYRITASDAKKINTNNISFKAVEERIGAFDVNIQDVIVPSYDTSNIIVNDYSVLDSAYNYTIDFIPENNIGDFEIKYCKQGDTNLLNSSYPGFEANGEGLVSTVSKKYVSDLFQLSSYNNIIKTLNGFEISDLSKESMLSVDVSGCAGKSIFYDYDYEETILDLSNFSKTNCYILNNSIVSDTVDGSKISSINLTANTFSCRIEGPYTIKYTIEGESEVTLSNENNNVYDFVIDKNDKPRSINISIEFLKPDGKLKNTKYSKYDFNIYTSDKTLTSSGGVTYLPNVDSNILNVKMKSYAGFSPVLKYIYVGNKLTAENGYYGIEFNTDHGTKLNASFENCRLQLKKFDKSGSLIDTIYDYKPYIEYTAREDVKVELNLSDYIVDSTTVSYGAITEDDMNPIAKKFILTIPKGRALISFVVNGKSNKAIVNDTLTNIIQRKGINYPDYDFYITKNDSSIIAKNKKDLSLQYIKVYKEDLFSRLSNTTVNIECSDNNVIPKFIQEGNMAVYSSSNNSDYLYIAFEPTQSNIYTAINEYNLVLPYAKDIMIVNTFNNNYNINSTSSMFYIIESLNDDFNVRFQTNKVFELCDVKALDNTLISIKTKDITTMEYNFNTITAYSDLLLGSSVSIPEYLTIDTGNSVDIRKFVLSMDYTINYFNKYSDTDNYLDYIFSETITINDSKINKLNYSNVNEIESITCNGSKLKENLDYSLLKTEGIILWLNNTLKSSNEILITYNINVPKSFNIDLDDLYEQIQYPINSMELASTAYITGAKANDIINLNSYDDYKTSDLVSFNFDEPGFTSKLDDGYLTLINDTPLNSIAVKTGYYYIDGREYYLLANDKYDNINKIDSVNYHNVTKDNNSLILKQKSENFIANSTFDLDTSGEIFELKCNEKDIEGISDLNQITVCDSFNYWNSFSSNLSIVKGYNGQGLKFTSLYNTAGYCYLPLSKFIEVNKNYVLSFYLTGDAKAYLGKEKNINDENIEFDYQSLIEIVSSIELSGLVDNIYEKAFTNNDGDNYYLILTGSGIIDDILLIEDTKYNIYNHTRNIDLLNLDVTENIYTNYSTRLFVTDRDSSIMDGTEINEDNYIINSSYIHWGYTNIKTINSYNDFNNCILDNVDLVQFDNKCIIKTGSKSGSITSVPIYVGNKNIIKSLLFKVNNVMFDQMKNFKISLLTSNNQNSGYKQVLVSNENINAIDGTKLSSYIKLMVELPPNKVINNIEVFIEYLSNENYAPSEMEVTNGNYTSKVLDAQFNERYLVKSLDIEDYNLSLSNYIFQVRASKENDEETVWTTWKTIEVDENKNITNRTVFDGYRYFQFRVLLKGENASIKIDHIDLEVI
jgi:hypothetical protein